MFWIEEEEVVSEFDYASFARGAENSIAMAFVVMCAEKIRRLLRLFLVTILAWFCGWQYLSLLCMEIRNRRQLKATKPNGA
jgi:hypothetical protein